MQIRPFKESDKSAILEISKHTWGGHDYLPYVLDEWINDAGHHIFVMEYRNRIVAFGDLKVIEDGQTGWLEGMRVRRWYRKRGYAKAMTLHLVNEATKIGVERLRLTTASQNVATRRLVQRIGMKELFRLKVFWKWDLDRVRWSHETVKTVSCTPKEASVLLKAQPSLLPEDIMIYGWYALDATDVAIESIGEFAQFWKGIDSGTVRSFSLGFLQTEPDSKQWNSTVYALDNEAFLSALSAQVQAAKDHGAAGLMCLHPVRFQTVYKMPWLKRSVHKMALILYEKRHPFVK